MRLGCCGTVGQRWRLDVLSSIVREGIRSRCHVQHGRGRDSNPEQSISWSRRIFSSPLRYVLRRTTVDCQSNRISGRDRSQVECCVEAKCGSPIVAILGTNAKKIGRCRSQYMAIGTDGTIARKDRNGESVTRWMENRSGPSVY